MSVAKPMMRFPATRWPKLLIETRNWQKGGCATALAVRMMQRMYDGDPYSTVVEPQEPILSPVWGNQVLDCEAPRLFDDYIEQLTTALSVSSMWHEVFALESNQQVERVMGNNAG